MATEADLIQKFKDLNIPVGADFEELIHAAFAGSNLADIVNSYDSRIATVETDLTTKADDSRVVHSTDMRKPASDVAGIEEVSAGLSTKVTDNKDGTEQLNGGKVQPFNKLSDTIGGRNVLLGTQVDNVIPSMDGNNWNFHTLNPTSIVPGKVYTISAEVTLAGSSDSLASIRVNGPDSDTTIVGTDSFPADGNRHSWSFTCPTGTTLFGIMIYAGITGHTSGIGAKWHHIKIEQGSIATDWTPAPEDKADDSKVAHLSGANNFDTVPTVNNNPLLLASSLPSDLARTSQQTNFTAGLKSGGLDVATAADLKSVEDKAWHMKSLPDVPALKNISLLYQVDDTNKKMNIVLNGKYSSATAGDSTGLLIADFSDIIQGITSIIMKNNTNKSGFFYYDQNMQQSPNVANQVNIVFSGTKLYMNTGSNSYPRLQISGADYLCLMYGSTISYTELV